MGGYNNTNNTNEKKTTTLLPHNLELPLGRRVSVQGSDDNSNTTQNTLTLVILEARIDCPPAKVFTSKA